MNESEIRWIVENLFVGNKLGKNEAHLETGRPIDLKAIRAPVIVFASHGDNITPPQQALNWILDTYADESEIEIRGQRIIYMVHDEVGHLGIFVSSSVAKREHTQVASTLKTIEALPAGLYEMKIDDVVGEGRDKHFTVSFHKRTFSDVEAEGGLRSEEDAFAAVARLSDNLAEVYDTTVRPIIRQTVTSEFASRQRELHPLRVQHSYYSSQNPLIAPVANLAELVRMYRQPVSGNNPFQLAEVVWAEWIETSLQTATELRAWWCEQIFLATYAGAWGEWYGTPNKARRARKSPEELRALPVVVDAIQSIDAGGLVEAVIRMLIMLADSRGNVRRDRLERSSEVLTQRPLFADLTPAQRARIIHTQGLVVHFEPEKALETLQDLLPDDQQRNDAINLVDYVVGGYDDMAPTTKAMLRNIRSTLDLPFPSQLRTAAE